MSADYKVLKLRTEAKMKPISCFNPSCSKSAFASNCNLHGGKHDALVQVSDFVANVVITWDSGAQRLRNL